MKYKFYNPGIIKARGRLELEPIFIDVSGDIWFWEDAGFRTKVDWSSMKFGLDAIELFKGFICNRLLTKSIYYTVKGKDVATIIAIDEMGLKFPWGINEVNLIVDNLIFNDINKFYSFISLYKWSLAQNIDFFTLEIYYQIKNKVRHKRTPYKRTLLYPNYLTPIDELKILEFIDLNSKVENYKRLRDVVILNISFELGLRPVQLYSLDTNDFFEVTSKDGNEKYYSLNIQLAKKISNSTYQKKSRSISEKLGSNINKLIHLKKRFYDCQSDAIFISKTIEGDYIRMSTTLFSKIISRQMTSIGFNKGDGATLLRHHLAQSLADQGTPADIIAELLGHNSTVSARAYIAATPEIASIKTKALGKNETYGSIMKMMLTGEIIEKPGTKKSQWVKGMIGDQYIGGIGVCGLSENTSCPKNPVYSCYTCQKFHPFIDGNHEEVKINIQRQAQYNVDIANASMDLEYNRPSTQLETTIIAVNTVIEKCNMLLSKSKV